MKSSCIAHPKNDVMLILRRWQVDACDGNHCAAALLAFFEYWHNIKLDQQGQAEKANRIAEMHGDEATQDTSLLQFHNTDELQAGILDLYGAKTIEKTLPLLITKGFISLHSNPNPRYHFDKTRYILFHPDAVNLYLSEEKVRNRSRKSAAPYRKSAAPYRKNAAAITEITSETSSEISPNPTSGEQNNGTVGEHEVCSGDARPMADMTQSTPLPRNSRAAGTAPRQVAQRAKDAARRTEQESIATCPYCDTYGYVRLLKPDGTATNLRCTHALAPIRAYLAAHEDLSWPHAPPGASARSDGGPAP